MAEKTSIEWADKTFSPWTGCAKISDGCAGCYAAHLMDTRMHRVEWGEPGAGEGTRSLMSDDYWRKPLAWNRQAEKDGTRPKVFPSLCDPFDTAVPDQWRHRFFDLMEQTPRLIWLLLTKRIGNVPKLTDPLRGERCLPRNAAIGATFVNQAEWDRDLSKLYNAWLHTDCMFTFASLEPLLGPIRFDISDYMPSWVIVGGETTQGAHEARPMLIDWVRSIRDQCAVFKTPFLFKQFGDYGPDDPAPGAHTAMRRMGKRTAGRHLDGRTHDEFPQAALKSAEGRAAIAEGDLERAKFIATIDREALKAHEAAIAEWRRRAEKAERERDAAMAVLRKLAPVHADALARAALASNSGGG